MKKSSKVMSFSFALLLLILSTCLMVGAADVPVITVGNSEEITVTAEGVYVNFVPTEAGEYYFLTDKNVDMKLCDTEGTLIKGGNLVEDIKNGNFTNLREFLEADRTYRIYLLARNGVEVGEGLKVTLSAEKVPEYVLKGGKANVVLDYGAEEYIKFVPKYSAEYYIYTSSTRVDVDLCDADRNTIAESQEYTYKHVSCVRKKLTAGKTYYIRYTSEYYGTFLDFSKITITAEKVNVKVTTGKNEIDFKGKLKDNFKLVPEKTDGYEITARGTIIRVCDKNKKKITEVTADDPMESIMGIIIKLEAGKTYYIYLDTDTTASVEITKIHSYKGTVLKKASFDKDGVINRVCKYCGRETEAAISRVSTVKMKKKEYKYTGNARKPDVIINADGKSLSKGKDYTLVYSEGRVEAGTYSVTVKLQGEKYTGEKTLYFDIIPTNASIKAIDVKTDSADISWKKTTGATGYAIYRLDMTTGKWKKIDTTKSAKYTAKNLDSGTEYIYSVKPYAKKSGKTYWARESTQFAILMQPDNIKKVTPKPATKTVTLKWDKVSGINVFYLVCQKNGDKWVELGVTDKTSFKVENLKPSKKYTFSVTPFLASVSTEYVLFSEKDTVVTTKTVAAVKLSTPEISKVNPGEEKVTLVWKNIDNESGYEVYYSTKKDSGFKKAATVKADVRKATVENLESGKTYYFKVRAYKSINGEKTYSDWSAVKSGKIK